MSTGPSASIIQGHLFLTFRNHCQNMANVNNLLLFISLNYGRIYTEWNRYTMTCHSSFLKNAIFNYGKLSENTCNSHIEIHIYIWPFKATVKSIRTYDSNKLQFVCTNTNSVQAMSILNFYLL